MARGGRVNTSIRIGVKNASPYPATLVLSAPDDPEAGANVVDLEPGQRRVMVVDIETTVTMEKRAKRAKPSRRGR